jgi:murein DD-endopeptidase MepM/ murein hydrolase activator NlpD
MGNAGIINYYNLGTNYMLVSVAVGGIYLIPSFRSFVWAALLVPVSYLLVIGLGRITFTWGLPVFSLPFCIVVILFLYCLRLRKVPGKLVPTPIQYFSPEVNLYRYLNGKERLMNRYYFPLQLPFLGEWMVSQGYEGQLTHKGDWSKAIDFVILDNEMKTYANPGILPEHFYCFNKPVLSPGDGIVEEVVDHVPDNAIGQNNVNENWGNSIVIRHADNLYSKVSHLKQHSIKVIKGAWVKKGEIIAQCGNSGRSPEPHLHFQVQATPYIGSKTIYYPVSYFKSRRSQQKDISNFQVPIEGSFVSNILTDAQMQRAFAFQPGFCMQVEAEGYATEEWEVFNNAYNESYLYCKQNDSYAYFINNGTVFYFTNFFGKKKSLLYEFYLAAYKVMLASDIEVPVKDQYPLNVYGLSPLRWLQDLVAPFWIFIRIEFEMLQQGSHDYLNSDQVTLNSKRTHRVFSFSKEKSSASIHIQKGNINHFTIRSSTYNIMAICKYKN